MPRPARRWLIPVVLAATAACGSTVQLDGVTAGSASSGLGTDLSGTDAQALGATPTSAPTDEATTGTDSSTPGAATDVSTTPTDGGVTDGSGSVPTTTVGSKVTAPISIGVLMGKAVGPAIAAIGGSNGPTVDGTDAVKYFISYYNAHGGIAGRKIQPVYSFIDPMSSDYETQAQGACANFTQDHHVAAVLSFEANYYSTTYTPCIDKAKVPNFVALAGGVDDEELARYKTLVSVSAPTINRRMTALIKGMVANGTFTAKNKIGVIVEDCPFNARAYTKTVAPLLKSKGLTFIKRSVGCAQGFGDAAALLAAFGNSVLPFKAAGVDRVMFVSGFEQVGSGTFEKQARSQSYAPTYALTSTSSVGVNDMGMPAGSLSRVQNVGWAPTRDVNALQPGTAATKRCRTMWRGYPEAQKRVNSKDVELTCEGFFALEAALMKSNGLSTSVALLNAVSSLGSSYDSPTTLNGATLYTSARRDGPQLFATSSWKGSCTCFVYTTKPAALA